jgi:hypothetical protein
MNIEIHGIPQLGANAIRIGLYNLLRDEPFVEDLVIEVYPTTVEDREKKTQPFVRLVSTPNDYEARVIALLGKVFNLTTGGEGIDIEILELKRFIAKKQ